MRVKMWVLLNALGEEVEPGAKLMTFRGESVVLVSGVPPLHMNSSGRVTVLEGGKEREVYPSVVGLVWRRVTTDIKPKEVKGEDGR